MEERLIDEEDPKLIKLKRTKEGEQDAVDDSEALEEGEVLVALPDEEYDEALVGLTPSQLEKELERRKKAEEEARAECEKLVEGAQEAEAQGDFAKAESFYAQAACYAFADERILEGLWRARTENFTKDEPFFVRAHAEEFTAADDKTKAYVRENVGERLRSRRETLKEEEAQIAPDILKKQSERGEAFAEHHRYYRVRALGFTLSLIAFLIAAIVSASFLVRTTSIAPVVCLSVFGALAVVSLAVLLVYTRKLLVASRYLKANAALSSTEEGAQLESVREKIACLDLILED